LVGVGLAGRTAPKLSGVVVTVDDNSITRIGCGVVAFYWSGGCMFGFMVLMVLMVLLGLLGLFGMLRVLRLRLLGFCWVLLVLLGFVGFVGFCWGCWVLFATASEVVVGSSRHCPL
jgi:hypothetical protein